MTLSEYELSLHTKRPLPSMDWLLDVVCSALEAKLGMSEDDYQVAVSGPPELALKVRL